MTTNPQNNNFELPAAIQSKIKSFETSGKKGLIFVGNEASLTGAPMVLLSLVETFSIDGYECFVILPKGGQLLDRYQKTATVLLCDDNIDSMHAFLEALKPSVENGKIAKTAIANSVAVLKLQTVLKQHGLRVLSLVHELADYYPSMYFNKLYDQSNHVIFSSEFSLLSALKKSSKPEAVKLEVKSQGLLPSDEKPAEVAASRTQIRAELNASKDVFVVFACGSITLRKGIDCFVQVARDLQRRSSKREILFVWIGDNPVDDEAPLYFASWDIKQMRLENIRLLKPRPNLAPWFAGADVFLLPSKQDPMPCVAHSALAAGLPVIAFKNAGGIQELLQQGGGTLVDYGDVAAMANAVADYLQNEDQRISAGQQGQQLAKQKLQFSEYYQHIKHIVEKTADHVPEHIAQPTIDERIEFLKERLRARLSSLSWRSTQGLRLIKKWLKPANKGNGSGTLEQEGEFGAIERNGDSNIEESCASKEFYLDHLRESLQSIRTSLSWRLSRPIRSRQMKDAPYTYAAIKAILSRKFLN